MTLISEDGTGKVDSESYATVTFADTHFSNRGVNSWAAFTTAQKESYLRMSTDFMLQRYRALWMGYRKYSDQSLDWPRVQVEVNPPEIYFHTFIGDTIVPIEVQRACAELALRSSTYTDGLFPDITDIITKETIGPITTEYDKRSPASPQYKAIDAMIAVYLKDGGMASSSRTVQRA